MKTIYKKKDPMRNLFLKVHQNKDENTISDGRGYRLMKCKEHPAANSLGYVKTHRLVAEQKLGRFLYSWEIVHHKKEKSNNQYKNLEVCVNISEHNRKHHKYNDPKIIQQVLKAARNPLVKKSDLKGVHKKTIDLICKNHNVQWQCASVRLLDKKKIKKLAKIHTVAEVAEIVDVSVSTLRRRFPKAFPKLCRGKGWLNEHKIAVEDSVKKVGIAKTARAFDTTRKTISEYLERWEKNESIALPLYEQQREKVFELLRKKVSMTAIAEQFDTNRTTIGNAIYRWSNNGELPNDIVSLLNSDPHRKLRLRYKS